MPTSFYELKTEKKIKTSKKVEENLISDDDFKIITNLKNLKLRLDSINNNFEYVTDPALIDSYIYEILSLNQKYTYYLNLCKERGLIANGF